MSSQNIVLIYAISMPKLPVEPKNSSILSKKMEDYVSFSNRYGKGSAIRGGIMYMSGFPVHKGMII